MTTAQPDCRPFSRSFPVEIEHSILACLGQSDLTRTALVCRQFRAVSDALLLRHIARWTFGTNADGEEEYRRLWLTHKVVYRLVKDVQLSRHVRYFDLETEHLHSIGRPLLAPSVLHGVWSSMTNLVALALRGQTYNDDQLGLTDVYFPHLRRLRLDDPAAFPSLVTQHLAALTHLRLERPLHVQETSAEHIRHYEGPLEPAVHLHFAALEHCIIRGDLPANLAGLSLSALACPNLRILVAGIEIPEAALLRLFQECPQFPRIDVLGIFYGEEDTQLTSEPKLSALLAPFPSARRVWVFDQGWDGPWQRERYHTWADIVAETCKDALVVAFAVEHQLVPAGSGAWTPQEDAWFAYDIPDSWVVLAVPE